MGLLNIVVVLRQHIIWHLGQLFNVDFGECPVQMILVRIG